MLKKRFFGTSPFARALAAVGALALMTSLAAAQAAAPDDKAKPKKEGWDTGINAALTLTRGNSKTLLVNGGLISEYKKGANELRLEIRGAYGESTVTPSGSSNSTDQTTLQNAKGVVEYKRLFTKRNYAYANGELMHDHIADIEYRAVIGPGLGRYLLKSDLQSLSAEAGVAYVRQSLASEEKDTVNLRLAQRYEIKLPAKSKLWEALEYLVAFDDFENYFVNLEVGAEAAMTEIINLRIVFLNKYNNIPAQDKDKNDLQLIAGLGIKL